MLVSLGQGNNDLHIVDGEEAGLAVDHALIPILVYLIGEDDDVSLFEAKLTLVLWLKVIQGATARLVQHLRLYTEINTKKERVRKEDIEE